MPDDHFRAPQSVTAEPPPKRPLVSKVFIAVIAFIVLIVGFFIVEEGRAQQQYLIKSKLSKVLSAIDPLKTSIAMYYQETGKLPQIKTAATQDNQGQRATPEWEALGFSAFPSLPREIDSLSVAPGGEIVVVIANIREGIDHTEVHIKPADGSHALKWNYTCTSENAVLKNYFQC